MTELKPAHNIGTHLKGIETSFQVIPLLLKSFHFWVSYIFEIFSRLPSVFKWLRINFFGFVNLQPGIWEADLCTDNNESVSECPVPPPPITPQVGVAASAFTFLRLGVISA
jgi:hypothetical protein